VQPQLSPWSAIGELYRYKVVGKDYTAAELKTAEDWILEKQFRQVRALSTWWGRRPDQAVSRGRGSFSSARPQCSLAQLQSAIANANQNVGGQRITWASSPSTCAASG